MMENSLDSNGNYWNIYQKKVIKSQQFQESRRQQKTKFILALFTISLGENISGGFTQISISRWNSHFLERKKKKKGNYSVQKLISFIYATRNLSPFQPVLFSIHHLSIKYSLKKVAIANSVIWFCSLASRSNYHAFATEDEKQVAEQIYIKKYILKKY